MLDKEEEEKKKNYDLDTLANELKRVDEGVQDIWKIISQESSHFSLKLKHTKIDMDFILSQQVDEIVKSIDDSQNIAQIQMITHVR